MYYYLTAKAKNGFLIYFMIVKWLAFVHFLPPHRIINYYILSGEAKIKSAILILLRGIFLAWNKLAEKKMFPPFL